MIDRTFLLPADDTGREIMEKMIIDDPSINKQVIGKSILSRPIYAYLMGQGGRRVIYFGAHHALESVTCNLLFAFMHAVSVQKRLFFGVDCQFLMNKYTYVVVPCVNPDGIDIRMHGARSSPLESRQMRMSGGDFSAWQANARGVDLNHNYPVGFYEYKKIEAERGIVAGAGLYSGEFPLSEPECAGVMRLISSVMPCGVISLHTQGEEIFYGMKTVRGKRIGKRLADACSYRLSVPTDSAAFGGLCDYTGALGIPSYTVEVGRGKNPLSEECVPCAFERIFRALLAFPTML